MKKTSETRTNKKSPAKVAGKKPWNRINQPVYSISSIDSKGNQNMNIITYVTAISMKPKLFIVGIYINTKTLVNIESNPHFVLQLLASTQYRMMTLLGKKSGHDIDKIARLQKRKEVTAWNGFTVLKNCLAVIEMKVTKRLEGCDHTIFICEVKGYKNLHAGKPLTLDTLRAHKLIRI